MAAVLLSLAAAACGSTATNASPVTSPSTAAIPSGAPDVSVTRRSEGSEVTVEATWTGPGSEASFDIKLDTHSVDLDGLDLSDALLRNNRGETVRARPWAAPKGGHHREGRLTFDGDAARFLADATWIELVINGVGGVPERVLRWEVNS